MNIRFTNVCLLDPARGEFLCDRELWVKGNRIAYIGRTPEKGPENEDFFDAEKTRQINGKGNLLMPGFVNAHAHTAMTFLRSYAENLPLSDWLFGKILPMEDKLRREDIRPLSTLGMLECLSSGITTNFDMYYYPDVQAEACVDLGYRTVFCGGITAGPDGVDKEMQTLEERYNLLNHYDPLIRYVPGAHAEYTNCREMLDAIGQFCRKHHEPFFAHNSETRSETEECVARHGLTPTGLMEELGMFEYGGGGFHCVYLSESDEEIFLRRGLTAVINSASNAKLASGIAPVVRYSGLGINLALGTDGVSSNNALDMFREMYLTAVLAKLNTESAEALPAMEVLRMATVNGARALGFDDLGILETGALADLIMIDLAAPNMQPPVNIPDHLVYSAGKSNVLMTMIDGKVLYENGGYTGDADPEKTAHEVAAILARMEKE